MILISRRLQKQMVDSNNNLETKLNFSKRMLKFKNQKTTTIFPIAAIKAKNNTYFLFVVYMLDDMISY